MSFKLPLEKLGIDGFPINCEMQQVLDEYLRASIINEHSYVKRSLLDEFEALHRSNEDCLVLLRAMNARARWLAMQGLSKEEIPEFRKSLEPLPPWLIWCDAISNLYRSVLEKTPELPAGALVGLCQLDGLDMERLRA